MDNASKALIMAGGVLIALAVISTALYFYTTAKGYASSAEEMLSASQIQSFNRFYTAYDTPDNIITGVDAVNILNRALDDDLSIIVENSAHISKSTNRYVIDDSKNLLLSAFTYSYSHNAVGQVNQVIISDVAG